MSTDDTDAPPCCYDTVLLCHNHLRAVQSGKIIFCPSLLRMMASNLTGPVLNLDCAEASVTSTCTKEGMHKFGLNIGVVFVCIFIVVMSMPGIMPLFSNIYFLYYSNYIAFIHLNLALKMGLLNEPFLELVFLK